ncbi:MAG: NUDIX hydrolase [Pseudomonadota bacterium]
MSASPRLAVRAIIVNAGRLLLVNAYAGGTDPLWCAPGGGVERGTALPENLIREVYEETGLTVTVGALALVNEFHDPTRGFHQVEVFFRAQVTAGTLSDDWRDPERVVTRRGWFAAEDLPALALRPRSLPAIAFDPDQPFTYDPLEPIVPRKS